MVSPEGYRFLKLTKLVNLSSKMHFPKNKQLLADHPFAVGIR